MDKIKEKSILTMIYSENDFLIEDTEEPDFIVEDKQTGIKFGVEITEHFSNESEARVINIPNYVSKIIEAGKYNNKMDKKILPVKDVTVYPSGIMSNPQETKAIISDVLSRGELGNNIANIISNKNSKIGNYKKKAEEINLIIYDNTNFFSLQDKSEIYGMIYNMELVEKVIESKFNEIFLITKYRNKRIYYRLKISTFIFLTYLTFAFAKCFKLDNPGTFYLTLDMLTGLGMRIELYFAEEEDCIMIRNINTVVCFEEEGESLKIKRIYTDKSKKDKVFTNYIAENQNFIQFKDLYFKFLSSKGIVLDLAEEALHD